MTGQINLSDLEPAFTRTMARQIELSTTVANVEVEVEVRKYEVDTEKLIKCLQSNRGGVFDRQNSKSAWQTQNFS